MTTSLPPSEVTFLFIDLAKVGTQANDILIPIIKRLGGQVFKTLGGIQCTVFSTAETALAAAVECQRALSSSGGRVSNSSVRMALHSGGAEQRGTDYFGQTLNQTIQLLGQVPEGQIHLTNATATLVGKHLPSRTKLRDLSRTSVVTKGARASRQESVFQLVTVAGNLTTSGNSFIGRQKEASQVKRLLTNTPLITFTGPGGTGKTRFALQIAAEVAENFSHGVWLAELSSVTEASRVVQALTSSFGLREEPGRALLATLTNYLYNKHILLILDNCEHLLSACASVVETLLRTCLHLRIIATSREPLGVNNEMVLRLPSLSLPDNQQALTVEAALDYDALKLFNERAKLVKPDFQLTADNVLIVSQLCQRLDGIPLALELAAAQMNTLNIEDVTNLLKNRFNLPNTQGATGSEHHYTLRTTIDWSYNSLEERQQILLRRLAVFSGGWSIDEAEEICSDVKLPRNTIADSLTQLERKSLLGSSSSGEARYYLLETIRQYAQDKLEEAGEERRLARRHFDWFLRLSEGVMAWLSGPRQLTALKRLDSEQANLQAALDWSLESAYDLEGGLRLAAALGRFWLLRGYLSRGRTWLDKALIVASTQPNLAVKLRFDLLDATARIANVQDDYPTVEKLASELEQLGEEEKNKKFIVIALDLKGVVAHKKTAYSRAKELLERSLALAKELNDSWAIMTSLNNLGNVYVRQGDYVQAKALLTESLERRREFGDRYEYGRSLNNLGIVLDALGDYTGALALYEEGLRVAEELGDPRQAAVLYNNMGFIAQKQGDLTNALFLYKKSLAISHELGLRLDAANTTNNLGFTICMQGDYMQARQLFNDALKTVWEIGDKRCVVHSLQGLASVALEEGEIERAVRLEGTVEAQREAIGVPLPLDERPQYERTIARMRALLPPEEFAAIWAEGRRLSSEEAYRYALIRDQNR